MIASGMFFMCYLRDPGDGFGRSSQRAQPSADALDAGMVAAQSAIPIGSPKAPSPGTLATLSRLTRGNGIYEAATNGLWEADIVVHRHGVPQPVDR